MTGTALRGPHPPQAVPLPRARGRQGTGGGRFVKRPYGGDGSLSQNDGPPRSPWLGPYEAAGRRAAARSGLRSDQGIAPYAVTLVR